MISTKLIVKNMKKYLYDRNIKYYLGYWILSFVLPVYLLCLISDFLSLSKFSENYTNWEKNALDINNREDLDRTVYRNECLGRKASFSRLILGMFFLKAFF